MDDFIDDSGDLDDLSRRDFEETLRSINKNYDTKKWKMNERLIDERSVSITRKCLLKGGYSTYSLLFISCSRKGKNGMDCVMNVS